MRRILLLAIPALLAGCHTGTLADPSDPSHGEVSIDVVKSNLESISMSLLERQMRREISSEQYKELVSKAAAELTAELHIRSVSASEAWQYGDLLRSARSWDEADDLLRKAVDHAKLTRNEDRQVNDTLRLAHVRAEKGEVESAIELTEETFAATPGGSAPILPATLYEIVPAARGKGHDAQLAQLLEGAAEKHLSTRVNPATVPGRDFLIARPYHVIKAYDLAAELYASEGKHPEAASAAAKADHARQNISELQKAGVPGPLLEPESGGRTSTADIG